jgi:hypothetical protein
MASIDAGSIAGFAGAAAQPIANLLGIEQSAEG